jgi:hypothetical protein
MKYRVIVAVITALLCCFSSCKKDDETRIQPPDCGESYCVAAYQMNKTYLTDYSAQNLIFQFREGYAVALWQNTTETPVTSFMLRVGSEQRPVVKGPGIFRFDQYETAYASMRIERDSLLTYQAYAGYIEVDSISENYFSGSFEVEARVDTLNNYLRFAGKFLVEN